MRSTQDNTPAQWDELIAEPLRTPRFPRPTPSVSGLSSISILLNLDLSRVGSSVRIDRHSDCHLAIMAWCVPSRPHAAVI
jgi:hypothetical protein